MPFKKEKTRARWLKENVYFAQIYVSRNNPDEAWFIDVMHSVDSKTKLVKEAVREYLDNHPDYIQTHHK